MRRVTSFSQLSEVQPTDWAFQALQCLVERYGCIEGSLKSTEGGDRTLTRYEFAVILNACFDRLMAYPAFIHNMEDAEHSITIRRLQEEFAPEIATLNAKIDGLEARTTRLEGQHLLTNTMLHSEPIVNVSEIRAEKTQNRSLTNCSIDAIEVEEKSTYSPYNSAYRKASIYHGFPKTFIHLVYSSDGLEMKLVYISLYCANNYVDIIYTSNKNV